MVQVQKLTKFYGSHRAIHDLTFDIEKGQIVGFLGPNGAGKSTTLRILTGFMPATQGRASVAGYDVFTQSMKARKVIGYLPESTPLYTEMRVREYLKFRARLKGVTRSTMSSALGRVAERCRINEFIDRPIGQLSKGMKQRVGLADALIHDPQVIFLDEPTIGLDPTQIRETRQLIAELGQTHTVVLSSHILSEIEALCSQVIIIANGGIVAQGTPSALREQVSSASRIIVEVHAPEQAVTDAVGQLKHVVGVSAEPMADGWVRLQIETQQGSDAREIVARRVNEAGWPLREIRHEVAGLEDYFIKIVAQQDNRSQQ